jgi:hypothetical protein
MKKGNQGDTLYEIGMINMNKKTGMNDMDLVKPVLVEDEDLFFNPET